MREQLFMMAGVALLTPFANIQGQNTLLQASKKKPNVVFMIADDLGYGDLSCYGQKLFRTPNIDRLALNGMRFTQCYAGSTVSAPSRCSLVTGLHTGHAAIRGNREVRPEGQYPLPADTRTIFSVFMEAGYTTGAFGKWGLGYSGSKGSPENQGVDVFFGFNCQLIRLGVQRESVYELYNLAADPSEVYDISGLYPEIVDELKSIMLSEHTDNALWAF